MTTVSHAPGRHYEVRGHRLWVETEGDGPPLLLLAGLGPAGSRSRSRATWPTSQS